MRIGIDMDDTICKTTEMVHYFLEEYAAKKNLNPLDIVNDEFLREKFLEENLEEIYSKVEIKHDVKKVLKRIKNKGNEIFILTARSREMEDITRKWLKDNSIEIDYLIMEVFGEERGKVCKDYQIDLMIDDNPYNYKKVSEVGIPCLLFDDKDKYDLKQDYTTWIEIENYIERNH